jgi:transcription antitermination factor NusG
MRWFVLRCLTGSEFTAMAALCQRGFFAFSPVTYTRRRCGRRRRLIERRAAMFPGYLLAKMRHGYAAHGACPQVFGVVSVAGEPFPIPDVVVWDLMQRSGRQA